MMDSPGRRRLNTPFILRGFLLGLAPPLLCLTVIILLPPEILKPLVWSTLPLPPPEPTPPPPVIDLPQGDLPREEAGLEEWRINRDGTRELAGSGFLLRLPGGEVVAVTTAHSLANLGRPESPLDGVAFRTAGASAAEIECDTLFGIPGLPRTGFDLSGDFVFFTVPFQPKTDPDLILEPDPRPLPQPGERVLLYGGISTGTTRVHAGTVQESSPEAVWVLMDEVFEAGKWSGSPLVSRHTGWVVGMAVAQLPRKGALLLGFHPIGSLLKHAAQAEGFIPIAEYRRP